MNFEINDRDDPTTDDEQETKYTVPLTDDCGEGDA